MSQNDDEILEVDLLVIGGGMAGITAATRAATEGANVLLVEKGSEVGGSAALALGFFWTVKTAEVLREENPRGDPALGEVLIDGYDGAVEWLRGRGVEVTSRVDLDAVMGFPSHAHMFDVLGYFKRCQAEISAADGFVVVEADVDELLIDGGRVIGASVTDRDGTVRVHATTTLVATGGFQCDPELRAQHIAADGDHILPRSNPNSAGKGLRLALAAGAGTSAHMDGFYGHLVPAPLPNGLDEPDYAPLSMIFSSKCLLVDAEGARTFDESRGYFVNAQAIAKAAGQRGLLIGDQQVRDDDLAAFRAADGEQIDRVQEALRAGANACTADTLAELEARVAEWGYRNVESAVRTFNEQMATGDPADRLRNRRPLDQPTYFAIEVQPAITFTHGGIRIDEHCRALKEDGTVVPGLLAAGADAGGVYSGGYAGGLAMAAVFGLRAAATALAAVAE